MQTPNTVIVSEALARRFWPDQDPIGKRIKTGTIESTAPWLHHRRRRARGEMARAAAESDGRSRPLLPVPAAVAELLAAGADARAAGDGDRFGPPRDSRRGAGRDGVQRGDDGGAGGGADGASALRQLADGRVRGAGAAAGGDWRLWRAGAARRAADAGDRHPHGPGRRRRRNPAPRAAARPRPRRRSASPSAPPARWR